MVAVEARYWGCYTTGPFMTDAGDTQVELRVNMTRQTYWTSFIRINLPLYTTHTHVERAIAHSTTSHTDLNEPPPSLPTMCPSSISQYNSTSPIHRNTSHQHKLPINTSPPTANKPALVFKLPKNHRPTTRKGGASKSSDHPSCESRPLLSVRVHQIQCNTT